MRHTLAVMLMAAASAAGAAFPDEGPPQLAPRTDAPPLRPYRIILVGDSTLAPHSGWGGAFCAHHVKWEIACLNLARSARSTRSYRAEGGWDLALAEMRVTGYARTFVLIQMGHNDQAWHKGERWTELTAEFPANLRQFVREARAAGAVPVLLTPVPRREFRDGRLDNTLEGWAGQVRAVAAELGTPLVDVNRRGAALLQALGPVAAMKLAQAPPTREEHAAAARGTTLPPPAMSAPAAPEDDAPAATAGSGASGHVRLRFDYTHLGPAGAEAFAALVAEDLADAVPEIRHLLLP